MPYVTSIERFAMEKGREKGRLQGLMEGLALVLEEKFGVGGARLMSRVRKVQNADELLTLAKAIKNAATLAEARALLP
jgi:hypothetical protein